MCIDIMEIWFGIANGQISSNFYGVICLRHFKWLVIIVYNVFIKDLMRVMDMNTKIRIEIAKIVSRENSLHAPSAIINAT